MKTRFIVLLFATFTFSNVQAQFLKKLKDKVAENFTEDITQYYKEDNGVTHPVHEANMHKIVFSNQLIEHDNYNEDEFITDYKMGDPLYFRAFWNKSMYNLCVDHFKTDYIKLSDVSILVKYLIDGELIYEDFQVNLVDIDNWDKQKFTTFWGAVVHPTENIQLLQWTFKKLLIEHPELMEKEDEYVLGIELHLAYEDDNDEVKNIGLLAEGSLNVTQDMEGIQKLYASPGVGIPIAKAHDKDLEAASLTTLILHAEDKKWSEKYQKVVLTGRDWTVLRHNNTGQIIGRIRGIAGIGKWKDGSCRYRHYDIFQNYVGNDFKGKLSIYGMGSGADIPCNVLK
ncbi:hypothetical protein [Gramella sp. KN1008]|uniref:hypothetical protein n=1 Tax=Gramella sp. KN1008 TaxID=2529298 RepID=UPI0010407F40|nr:hypothetical protein [Gramella sp. KN1008]TBW25882.1 hypothetical protein EZJ28_14715 [Gramella sp. KN1008]